MQKSDDISSKDIGKILHPGQACSKRRNNPVSHMERCVHNSFVIFLCSLLKEYKNKHQEMSFKVKILWEGHKIWKISHFFQFLWFFQKTLTLKFTYSEKYRISANSWSATSIQGRQLLKGGNYYFLNLEIVANLNTWLLQCFNFLLNKLNFCCKGGN